MSNPAGISKPGTGGRWTLALCLLAMAAGFAYWYFALRPQAAQAAAAGAVGTELRAAPVSRQAPGAPMKFEPFVVNLADAGGQRYLRVGLSLVVAASPSQVKQIEEHGVKLLRIRSSVLELLSQQVAAEVLTVEGKLALKQSIQERAATVLAPVDVIDVLFTEFVVQ